MDKDLSIYVTEETFHVHNPGVIAISTSNAADEQYVEHDQYSSYIIMGIWQFCLFPLTG